MEEVSVVVKAAERETAQVSEAKYDYGYDCEETGRKGGNAGSSWWWLYERDLVWPGGNAVRFSEPSRERGGAWHGRYDRY